MGCRTSTPLFPYAQSTADHVGSDRLQVVYEVLRDLRELTDPWA